jgi:hypothetical protein
MRKCSCGKRFSGLGLIRDCYKVILEKGNVEVCWRSKSKSDSNGQVTFTHFDKSGRVKPRSTVTKTMSARKFQELMSASHARKTSYSYAERDLI